MYPQSSFDTVSCLERLLGIRSACSIDSKFPFFVEDIEGVDIKALAAIAKGSDLKGEDTGQFLINSAAREMMSDIETLLNNGFRMKEIVGDMCSTCSLLPSYTANSGIIVKSNVASRFKTLAIKKLTILCNFTGPKQITIDDGVTPVYYTPTFIAGTLATINIDYVTDQKQVKIFFTDNTVGLGKVSCSVNSGCGCGKSATSDNPASITGLLGGVESSTQYGFIPCIGVGCSYEQMVCGMISQTPNTFGLALAFKFGEKYFLHKNNSNRNNEVVSYDDGEQKDEVFRNYGKLYWAKMQGGANRPGIKNIINDYLAKNKSDKCVICDSKIFVSYATG